MTEVHESHNAPELTRVHSPNETGGATRTESVNAPKFPSSASFSSAGDGVGPYTAPPLARVPLQPKIAPGTAGSSPPIHPEPFFPSHPWSGEKSSGKRRGTDSVFKPHLLTNSKTKNVDGAPSWETPIQQQFSQRHHFSTQSHRHTVVLSNLPHNASLQDITKNIQGGQLVEVWQQKSAKRVEITFLEGAGEFVSHYKNADLFINSKKVNTTRHLGLQTFANMV